MRRKAIATVASMVAAAALAGIAFRVISRAGRRMDLRGKTALVCGGSRGLGRAIALELARRGANVAVCARNEEELDRIRDELAAIGNPVYVAPCDLRFEDDVQQMIAGTELRLGPIDVLVCNAATIEVGPIETMTVRDFDDAMESIWRTSLLPALEGMKRMRTRGHGTIAFITSIGGKIAVPHLAPYVAAKHAQVGLAETLRAELAKDGVHVLNVIPGLMRTGSHVHARYKGDEEKELAWFGAGATTPLVSIDADRAAKRIVSAVARGDSELTFTLPARLALRLHDLVPNLFALAMNVTQRLLPEATPEDGRLREDSGREGVDVIARSPSKRVAALAARSQPLVARHAQ